MKKLIVLAALIIILATAGTLVYREGSLPVDKTDTKPVTFVIRRGETLNEIINSLHEKRLIRNKLVFYALIKRLNLERDIQAGTFALKRSQNTQEIAESLTHGTLDLWVTLIEGWRKEEVAAELEKQFPIDRTEFLALSSEGSLFPDTYLIPTVANAQQIVTILENNFSKKFTPELQKKAEARGLSPEETIILASMVEREARSAEAKKEVANILLKRLQNDWPLGVDATIQYAVGYDAKEQTWWKRYLTKDDLAIDSTYNTYTNTGLPPTPIANPGLIAIEAAATADSNTPYWFYITDTEGRMHYAETLEEHNANVEKYLR